MIPAAVLIVIVNYRTAALTIDALASLEAEVTARGDTHVVVVDNDSGDGSVETIADALRQRGFGDWCTLRAAVRNGGFAAGNNAGMAWYRSKTGGASPEFIWLLNPDTRAEPGAIGALVDFLRAHPQAGIAGGRCLWENGGLRYTAFRFPSPLGEMVSAIDFPPLSRLLAHRGVFLEMPAAPQRVDWVGGSSLMLRGRMVDTIGPMDEGYFLYFEETEYCERAAQAGFETWTVPASRIVHIGGQSTGVTGQGRKLARRPRYWFFSRTRFLLQHYGIVRTHVATLMWIVAYPIGRLFGALRGKRPVDPPFFWWDFLMATYGPHGLMYQARKVMA